MMILLRRHRWVVLAGLFILGVILSIYLLGPRNLATPIQIQQYESEHGELHRIAYLVLDYKSNNEGQLPQLISDLAFYDTYNKGWPNCYVLPIGPNNSGILVLEKPGLWPDGSVAVCYSDLKVKRLTRTEFSALGLEQ